MVRQHRLVGVAFGDPLDMRTFSGLSHHLFANMAEQGLLAGVVSSGDVRWWDVLTGRLDLAALYSPGRRLLSRSWLWHPSTIRTLSRRIERRLQAFPDATSVLQVGTHVVVQRPGLVHACLTDLTVTQAFATTRFGMNHLSRRQMEHARLAQKMVFDSCQVIFVLSEWAGHSIVEDLDQDPSKVIAVGAGANMDPLPPAPGKYSSQNVLFVGYEWEAKGGPLLVKAFEIVCRVLPNATLTIVGCTPTIQHPRIGLAGSLRKDVPAEYASLKSLFQKATCFCLLPEFDPFPNVLLEAQATGTPVVTLDRGSRREAVRDGVTGVLVQQAEPEAVARALISILQSPTQAEAMGANARMLVAERFTWPVVVGNILEHITQTACQVCT